MDKIRNYPTEVEARLAHDLLNSMGVSAQIIGAKEYTAHVLGGGAGNFELFVHPEDAERAQAILKSVESPMRKVVESDDVGSGPPNYFKRAVFYACAAPVLLPIVFNYTSLVNAAKFWRHSEKDSAAQMKVLLILLLQVPTVILTYYLIKTLPGFIQQKINELLSQGSIGM